MGVCASYTTAWKYLKSLTTEARYLEMIQSGHWIWAYDNLNLKQHIRHEREGKYCACMYFKIHVLNINYLTILWTIDCHSSMMNVTS